MCLIIDEYKQKKSGVRSRPPQTWGAEEETQLSELYEEFKDAPGVFSLFRTILSSHLTKLTLCTFADPLGCIMPRLEIKRPKNRIVEKMLIMGLIQDRKELWKKRATKSNASGRKCKYLFLCYHILFYSFNDNKVSDFLFSRRKILRQKHC